LEVDSKSVNDVFGLSMVWRNKLSDVCEWFIVADGGEVAESQKP
jgi:hypothetical protein